MTEQSADKDRRTLQTTLQTLVQIGLTPEEIVQLRLADLHLAGKKPNIQFTSGETGESKTVELDMESHRALVNWLVARPDSITDFLFPGPETDSLEVAQLQALIAHVEPSEAQSKSSPAQTSDTARAAPETPQVSRSRPFAPRPLGDEPRIIGSRPVPPTPPEGRPSRPVGAQPVGRGPGRPMPPRSAPEMGAPPPGVRPPKSGSFQPPPATMPEGGEEGLNISLPTSVPKASPPPPVSSPPAPSGPRQPGSPPPGSRPSRPTPPVKEKPAASGPATGIGDKPSRQASPQRKTELGSSKTAAEAAQSQSIVSRRMLIPSVVGLVLACGLLCFGGGVIAWRSDSGQDLLASVGLGQLAPEPEATEESLEQQQPTIVDVSPIATPTLPPTASSTPLPTATLLPTDTVTPIPTDTPLPTDTPIPVTDTPAPTDTPVSLPTNTLAPPDPEESPTSEATATPAIKYGAPILLGPEEGFEFIRGNTIVLRWQPVGELAPDEQYAVRMSYRYNAETVFQGANIKETEWTVPLSLFGQVDPPENLYEWFVVIERINDDGSGTAISPESDKRKFTWK